MIDQLNCTCTFKAPCWPMDTTGCKIHTKSAYPCPQKNCRDYRPIKEPRIRLDGGRIWPLCVCGEIAQEHN